MNSFIQVLAVIVSGVVCVSSAHASAFIYDIDEYVQNNGTNEFVDSFSDGLEPPAGPLSGSDYVVAGSFGAGRESGGVLRLDGVDGVLDDEDLVIFCVVDDSDYFIADGAGGYLSGSFEINEGLWDNSTFGLTIDNDGHSGASPTYFENAFVGVFIDPAGSVFANWGNHTWDDSLNEIYNNFMQDITVAFGSNASVTMTLSLDGANQLTATWDYGSDGNVDLVKSGYSSMDLGFGVYSGAFAAFARDVVTSADPVPQRNVNGLGQNHPNPFNPSTTIYYGIAEAGHVELTVYDLAGRRVNTLFAAHVAAGDHEVSWDGRDEGGKRVASGVYLYQLRAGEYVETKRMVLVK